MEGGLDRQVPPVLKQERERLIDRKNVLESNINRITKEFQSLSEDLFQEEMKPLDSFEFELRMDEYLGWVYDEQKGFRSKEGRSQDLRQWLNSTKARKWADTLFGDMFESCRQYAWKVGHALENNSEGIECLTNYLQCEFFIATITGTIGSGSGSGSRPLICDHSFQKRKSKMVNILNEGVYSNKKHSNGDWWVHNKERERKKTKNKRENGTAAKKYFVDLYKKWSDRYFALYIMYKTQNKHGMGMGNPLLSLPFAKRGVTKTKEAVDTKVNVKVEKKPKRKVNKKSKNEKSEMELSEVDIIKQEDDGTESPPDDGYIDGISDSMDDDNIGGDEDKSKDNTKVRVIANANANANINGNDNDNDDDLDNSSSDEPLISVQAKRTKKEKTPEDGWQKLRQDNKALKDNMDQMDTKIRQLTNVQDLEMSSLRKQLHVSNRRGGDAESRNAEYEERIRSIKEEIASSKQAQQSLLNELNALRVRFEMLQNQSSAPVHGMMTSNANLFGFAGDVPQQLFHRSFSNPAMQSQPIPQTLPSSFPALHQIPAVSTFPAPSSFPNMFGFFGPNNFTSVGMNNGHGASNSNHINNNNNNNNNANSHNNYHTSSNNNISNSGIGNLGLPPLITDNRNSLPLVNNNDLGRLADTNTFFTSGNGFPKMDSVNNYELRSVASDTTFTWSHNEFAHFSHSPGDSIDTMDVDL